MAITTNSKIKPSEAGYQNISNLEGDTLTGTVAQNKAQFDAYPNLIKDHYNALVDDLITDLGNKADASTVPLPSNTTPLMDGADATAGTSTTYARGDHKHPQDTSKVPTTRMINGHSLAGDITLGVPDIDGLSSRLNAVEREVNNKVDIRAGYDLSSNDYTDADQTKVGYIDTDKAISTYVQEQIASSGGSNLTLETIYTNETGSAQTGLLHILILYNQPQRMPKVSVYSVHNGGSAISPRDVYIPVPIASIYDYRRGVGNYLLDVYAGSYSLPDGYSVVVEHDGISASWQGISH